MKGVNENIVSRDEFVGRTTVEDERFRRDKERLDKQESSMEQITKLITTTSQLVAQHERKVEKHDDSLERISALTEQTGQLVKRHDDMIRQHDERIGQLEARPAKRWDAVVLSIITALAAVFVTWLAARGVT